MGRARLLSTCRAFGARALVAEPYVRAFRAGYRDAHRERDRRTLVVARGRHDAERAIEYLGLSPRTPVFVTTAGERRRTEGMSFDRVVWVDGWRHGVDAEQVECEVRRIIAKRPGAVAEYEGTW